MTSARQSALGGLLLEGAKKHPIRVAVAQNLSSQRCREDHKKRIHSPKHGYHSFHLYGSRALGYRANEATK